MTSVQGNTMNAAAALVEQRAERLDVLIDKAEVAGTVRW
jgi:hypothetical protein